MLVDVLEATVSEAIQDCVENDLLPGLESKVSHVYGPQVEDVNLTIEETGESYFRVSGGFAMTATYQIGSDGDVRRGDGLEWEETRRGRYVARADLEDLAITIDECEVDSDDLHEDTDLEGEVSLEQSRIEKTLCKTGSGTWLTEALPIATATSRSETSSPPLGDASANRVPGRWANQSWWPSVYHQACRAGVARGGGLRRAQSPFFDARAPGPVPAHRRPGLRVIRPHSGT